MLRFEHRAHPLLVRGVGIGVDEADADRSEAPALAPARHVTRRVLVELAQQLAAMSEPPGHLADPVERYDALGLHPEVGVSITLGDALPRDLQDRKSTRLNSSHANISYAV